MRVLFDIETAGSHPSGLAGYALGLLAALARLRDDPDGAVDVSAVYAWSPRQGGKIGRLLAGRVPGVAARRIPVPPRALQYCPLLARPWLGPLRGPREGGRWDVVHTPANWIPPWLRRATLPRVVTLHDLAWHPDAPAHLAPARYRELVAGSLLPVLADPSTVVAAVSRFTRDEAVRRLGFPADRIVVTPEGVPWEGQPPPDDALRAATLAKFGLAGVPYLIAVGQLAPRKNHPALLAAFRLLRQADPAARLLVVGADGWDAAPIRRALAEAGPSVVHAEKVPTAELRALYAGARMAASASWYEGFGLPALEAMESGTPLVYASGTSMDEVAGDVGVAAPPGDAEAFGNAVVALWRGADERARRAEAGRRRATEFTWGRCAAATREAYRLAMNPTAAGAVR